MKKRPVYQKVILCLICFLTISNLINAQDKEFIVNAKLVDKKTKESIMFATVAVKNNKGDLVFGLVSDSKGEFTLKLKRGVYTLNIRYMGYVSRIINIEIKNNNLFLGNILMKEDLKLLKEVNVEGSSQIVESDRNVYIITKKLKRDASSLNDILPKLRGVFVDPLTDIITINNDSHVLILVDGKAKNQKYIRNISPDRILRLEIIDNPTGRYLTAGYTSVINVILKKNYCGYELYTEEKGLYSLDKSNGDDFLFSNGSNVNLTFTHKKLNIYGMYFNSKSNTNLSDSANTSLDKVILEKNTLDDNPNYNKHSLSHSLVFGFDVFINPKHILSLEITYKNKPLGCNNYTHAYLAKFTDSISDITEFTTLQNNKGKSNNTIGKLAYRWFISDDKKLDIDYGYSAFRGKNYYTYKENDLVKTDQTTKSENNYSRLEIDYSQDLNDKYVLNLGYRNTIKNNDNIHFDYENNYSKYNYKEIRNTFYSYLNVKFSEKLISKLGFALEQNTLKTLGENHNYCSFQPMISLFYRKSNKTSFKLKFRSYSNYPSNSQIEPFLTVLDRLISKVGNPELSCTTNYKTSISCNLFKNKLNIEPYYLYSHDYIAKTGSSLNQRYIFSYSNVQKYESFGLNISFNYPIIAHRMYLNFTGNFYSDKIKYNGNSNNVVDCDINFRIMYINSSTKTLMGLMLKKKNSKIIQTYGYSSNDNDYLAILVRQPLIKRLNMTLLYVLPVGLGFDYSLNNKYEHNNFLDYSKCDINMTKNLFMLKLTFNISKGRNIRTIKKKELIEREKKTGFF